MGMVCDLEMVVGLGKNCGSQYSTARLSQSDSCSSQYSTARLSQSDSCPVGHADLEHVHRSKIAQDQAVSDMCQVFTWAKNLAPVVGQHVFTGR